MKGAIIITLRRDIFSLILALILVIVIFIIYCSFQGTPWSRYTFAKEVDQYITTTYPNVSTNKQQIDYDFKSMQYSATITTDQQITFHVDRNYENSLEDDYYASIWNTRLTNELNDLVKGIEPTATAQFNIGPVHDGELAKHQQQLTDEIESHAKMFIYFITPFANNSEDLERSYMIIKEIQTKGYRSNIVLFFQNHPVILIDYAQVPTIHHAQDLEKYVHYDHAHSFNE